VLRVREEPLGKLADDDIVVGQRAEHAVVTRHVARALLAMDLPPALAGRLQEYLQHDRLLAERRYAALCRLRDQPCQGQPSLREANVRAADDFDNMRGENGEGADEVRANVTRDGRFRCCKCDFRYSNTIYRAAHCVEPCPRCDHRLIDETNGLMATQRYVHAGLVRARALGLNADVDIDQLHENSVAWVTFACPDCGELRPRSQIRELCREGHKCSCRKERGGISLSAAPERVLALYAGTTPASGIAIGTNRSVPWHCSSKLGLPASPNCTGLASEMAPKSVLYRYRDGGSLPTCVACRHVRLPQNRRRAR
jgi:hypothetical protein